MKFVRTVVASMWLLNVSCVRSASPVETEPATESPVVSLSDPCLASGEVPSWAKSWMAAWRIRTESSENFDNTTVVFDENRFLWFSEKEGSGAHPLRFSSEKKEACVHQEDIGFLLFRGNTLDEAAEEMSLTLTSVRRTPLHRRDNARFKQSRETVTLTRVEAPRLPEPKSIHEAAQAGDLIAARRFLEQGVSANEPGKDGAVPLYSATFKGFSEITNLLLKHGADVDVVQEKWGTPLHVAARSCDRASVSALLAAGADPNHFGGTGTTPTKDSFDDLYCAGVSKTLVEAGGRVASRVGGPRWRYDALDAVLAAEGPDELRLNAIKYLVEEAGYPLDRPTEQGSEPLLTRCARRSPLSFKFLLKKGLDPDAEDRDGTPLLVVAARDKRLGHALEPLLEAGAQPNVFHEESGGEWRVRPTVLQAAIANKDANLVKQLLQRGADPNFSPAGESPLATALHVEDRSIVAALVDAGAMLETSRDASGLLIHRDWKYDHELARKLNLLHEVLGKAPIPLPNPYSLRVQLVNESSRRPIRRSNFEVSLVGAMQNGEEGARARTDNNGIATFNEVKRTGTTKYTVSVIDDAWAGDKFIWMSPSGVHGEMLFESDDGESGVIPTGSTEVDINVLVHRLARVTGRIVSRGKPVSGLQVSLLNSRKVVTDDQGRFRIPLVDSGEHAFGFDTTNKHSFISMHRRVELETKGTEKTVRTRIDLGPLYDVVVLVRRGTDPVVGANVTATARCSRPDRGQARERYEVTEFLLTDQRGRVRFSDVPPCELNVRVGGQNKTLRMRRDQTIRFAL